MTLRRQLEAWLPTQLRGADGLAVTSINLPALSGFSATAVRFDAIWREDGQDRQRSFVARVALCASKAALFLRYNLRAKAQLMLAMARHRVVPAPTEVTVEDDPEIPGGPFVLTEFQSGRIPQDDPSYVARQLPTRARAPMRNKRRYPRSGAATVGGGARHYSPQRSLQPRARNTSLQSSKELRVCCRSSSSA